MHTTTIDLPTALLEAAHLDVTNVSREAAQLLALELVREQKISLGRAAESSQTPLAAFMDFVARHGVSPLRNSFEDLELERKSSERLGL
jgi:predicted HTH domain antitoxin